MVLQPGCQRFELMKHRATARAPRSCTVPCEKAEVRALSHSSTTRTNTSPAPPEHQSPVRPLQHVSSAFPFPPLLLSASARAHTNDHRKPGSISPLVPNMREALLVTLLALLHCSSGSPLPLGFSSSIPLLRARGTTSRSSSNETLAWAGRELQRVKGRYGEREGALAEKEKRAVGSVVSAPNGAEEGREKLTRTWGG